MVEGPGSNETINYCSVGHIAQLDLTDLAGTLYINLIVFVLLLALFERVRWKRSVYLCRDRLKHRVPPELPPGLFRWVYPLMSMPREKVLAYAGLDAFMLLRYIRFCRRVCLYSGVLGVIVLVPLYLHGDPSLHPNSAYVWRNPMVISLQNLRSQPKLFWVPVLFAYLLTFTVYYLLKAEYRKFLELRLYFVAVGDPDVHPQKNFSVMVDRIPHDFRSSVALYNLFNELFPGEVHSAVVSLRVEELEGLVQKRAWVVDQLERAIAEEKITGRTPHHWVPHGTDAWWWCKYLLCRGRRVQSIEYYDGKLKRLNAVIQSSQEALKKKAEALDKQEEKRQESHDSLQRGGGGGLTWRATRRAVSTFLIGDPETRASLLEAEYLSRAREAELQERGKVGTAAEEGEEGGATKGLTLERSSAGAIAINDADAAASPPPTPRPTGSRLLLSCLQDWTFGVLKACLRTGQVAASGARQVTKAVGLLTLGSNMSSTGFVTFKSLTCAAVCSEIQLTNQPFVFKIKPAPEPRDVIWANVATPVSQIDWREFTTSCIFAVMSLFWSIVVTGLYKIQSVLNTLQQDVFHDRQPTSVETVVNVAIEYVPTLLLLILLQLVPLVFWYSSYWYERLRTHSDVQASVMSRFFTAQMVNIYVTIVGGIFLSEITVILHNPRMIVTILGCQLPVVAIYFMQVILTKTFSATMWEFARVWPLLQIWFIKYCCTSRKRTPRERRQGVYAPPMAHYGWIYPTQLLVFTLCLTYAIIMPVLVFPCGALYFVFAEIMYTYHLLYVYIPQYESGGKLFYGVFNRTLIALLLSHITLIGYCVVLNASLVVPFLVPLPLTILPFYSHCQKGYYEASVRLSLLAARRIDEELVQSSGPGPGRGGGEGEPTSPLRSSINNRESKTSEGGGGQQQQQKAPPSSREVAGPNIDDYFELSAYAQPSLTEPPQAPEPFDWPAAEDLVIEAPAARRQASSVSPSKSRQGEFSRSLQEPLTGPSDADEEGRPAESNSSQTNDLVA